MARGATAEGVLQTVKGHLTKQQVTAIVSPTNTHLSLSRKVSSHIAAAVGARVPANV